jgi:hypothetical protein
MKAISKEVAFFYSLYDFEEITYLVVPLPPLCLFQKKM